jgi:hypothetical protein
VQPERTDTAGAQGSSGQASAAPRGTPVGFAGGAIAIAGTGVGTRAVTSFALNPLSLVGDETDKDATAFKTRFLDVAVVLPFSVNDTASAASSDGADFVGLRLRVNFLALPNASAVVEKLDAAYENALRPQGTLIDALKEYFRGSEDPGTCFIAIQAQDPDLIADGCPGLDLATWHGRCNVSPHVCLSPSAARHRRRLHHPCGQSRRSGRQHALRSSHRRYGRLDPCGALDLRRAHHAAAARRDADRTAASVDRLRDEQNAASAL